MRKRLTSLLLCICMVMTILISAGTNVSAGGSTPVSAQGLTLSKTATANGDGTYKISMEAYTTGDVTTTQTAVPTDFILVLDKSGSMSDSFGTKDVYTSLSENNKYMFDNQSDLYVFYNSGYFKVSVVKNASNYTYSYTDSNSQKHTVSSSGNTGAPPLWDFCTKSTQSVSKFDALKTAASNFVDRVYTNASTNGITGINHRISIISYSDNATTNMGLTEVKTGENTIKNTISGLSANGGTYTDKGLSNAKDVFSANPIPSGTMRNRVVVIFTDGYPGTGYWADSESITCANNAVSISNTVKNTYGAKVYSIGIFAGANPSADFRGTSDTQRANRFLHYISSNYPNATSLDNAGTGGSNAGYYLSANDNAALDNVFQTISIFQTISQTSETPTINLGSSTQVKDIISQYFKLPDGATSASINLYTANCTGDTAGNYTWATRTAASSSVKASISGKEVSITGFDFNSNFVSDTVKSDGTLGKKLIIEFNVALDGMSFGGNGIPTNADSSGVYLNNAIIANFNVPTVNLPINYDFNSQNQSIYISNNADLKGLISNLSGYLPNGKNNAFVNIVYTVKNGTAPVGTYTISAVATQGVWEDTQQGSGTPALTEDNTDYTIECAVTPVTTGVISASSKSKTATVYVFKPTVKSNDTWSNYGSNANLSDNIGSVSWNCKITGASAPLGSVPTLSYEFINMKSSLKVDNPSSLTINEISNFKISGIKSGTADITSNTTITPATCSQSTADHAVGRDFTIHINTFDLKINKTVSGTASIDQVFIIKVKDAVGKTFNVTIDPNDFNGRTATQTVAGLYCGTNYTVSEDSNWSWRYTADKASQIVNESLNGATKNVSVTNTRTNSKWLSGEANAKNTFGTVWSAVKGIFN